MRTVERSGARLVRFRFAGVSLVVDRFATARFGRARVIALPVLRFVVDRFAVGRLDLVARVFRLAMRVSLLFCFVVSEYRNSRRTGNVHCALHSITGPLSPRQK